MYIGPLVFAEILEPKPWGGRLLARFAGKKLPPGKRIGESWELWDKTVVRDGMLKGQSLQRLLEKERAAILGDARSAKRFPLLVKLIDARERLSVQVHPDDACARAMRVHSCGKAEAWYVLRAGAGARIVTGFKKGTPVARLRPMAGNRELVKHLSTSSVRAGQAWFCPGGAVHALGPNLLVLEVHQNCDVTFRLYDWGRVGLDGRARPLHLDESMKAIGKQPPSLRRVAAKKLRGTPFSAARRIASDKFVLDEWHVDKAVPREKGNRFEILHVVQGRGKIADAAWPTIQLKKGMTVLIPACVREYQIVPGRPLTLVRAAEPE